MVQYRTIRAITILLALLCLSGCVTHGYSGLRTSDVHELDVALKTNGKIALPINARAEITLPLGDGSRKIIVNGAQGKGSLNDGLALKATSQEIFSKIFSQAGSRGNVFDPHFSIRVKSSPVVDTYSGKYTVNLDVSISYGSGEWLGDFSATGIENSKFVNDQVALNNAYKRAFIDIAEQMINADSLLSSFQTGITDKHIRVTERAADKVTTNLEYQSLLESVVTIVVTGEKTITDGRNTKSIKTKSHGSGFFIDNKGTILTNNHVIKNAKTIQVVTKSGGKFDAAIVTQDEWVDLALLHINFSSNNFIDLKKSSKKYNIGDEVIAIGSPIIQDLDYTVSKGIISSLRLIDGHSVVQTDAAVNPGNSGGPLVQFKTKQLLGVITISIRKSEGLAFALSTKVINDFMNRSKRKVAYKENLHVANTSPEGRSSPKHSSSSERSTTPTRSTPIRNKPRSGRFKVTLLSWVEPGNFDYQFNSTSEERFSRTVVEHLAAQLKSYKAANMQVKATLSGYSIFDVFVPERQDDEVEKVCKDTRSNKLILIEANQNPGAIQTRSVSYTAVDCDKGISHKKTYIIYRKDNDRFGYETDFTSTFMKFIKSYSRV